MADVHRILDWATTLATVPKVLLSLVVVAGALFLLVVLWRAPSGDVATNTPPDSLGDNPAAEAETDTEPPIQRTSGDNSPIISGDSNTVNINQRLTMQPLIEGFTASFSQIPSPRSDAPFAVEVVVQVQATVSPVSLGFYIDQQMVEGRVRSPSPLFNFVQGTLNDDPQRSFWVRFDQECITPN